MTDSINWCNLKKNAKHIGEVSTSRADGSPTGAEILTSTNGVTGQVRDTLAGKFKKMDDAFNSITSSQFIVTNFGNWSTVAGQQIEDADRLKGYMHPDDSGNVYAVKGSVTLPITRPSTPIGDDRFYLASAVNVEKFRTEQFSAAGYSYQGEWLPNIQIPAKASRGDGYALWEPASGKIIVPSKDEAFTTSATFQIDLSNGLFRIVNRNPTKVIDLSEYLKCDGSDEGARINEIIASVAAESVSTGNVIKVIFPPTDLYSTIPTVIKSGDYQIEFIKGCSIKYPPGCDGMIIGDVGSNPFSGEILYPFVRKDSVESSDTAYSYVNFTGFISNPRQENFAYGYKAIPSSNSRVAYSLTFKPTSRNHKRMFFLQPQDATSYVNSNLFIGGRAENFMAGRLEYNALLDNQSGAGCQHNYFDGVILEGYSGSDTNCGKASIKCINGANSNYFANPRCEPYQSGWEEGFGTIFTSDTENNNLVDSYYNSTVKDYGENNYDVPKGMKKTVISSGSETGSVELKTRLGKVTTPFLFHEDKFASSGGVNYLKYTTPRTENRNGNLISLTTGYGEVFKVDDAGSIFPRDNFADLGSSTHRYRVIHAMAYYVGGNAGVNATFTTSDGKTVSVQAGIVTNIS